VKRGSMVVKGALYELNVRVTAAILRAERLEDERSPHALAAYAEVSGYEEALATLLPADDLAGAIARVGAVTAAVRARSYERARLLTKLFSADPALTDARRAEMFKALASIPSPASEDQGGRSIGRIGRWRHDQRQQFAIETPRLTEEAA
jgi:hypothetical protein